MINQDHSSTQMNSSSADDESKPQLTAQSSTGLSPRMPAFSPDSRADILMPSIESPGRDLYELSSTTTPRTIVSPSTYDSITDTFKQLNLHPPNNAPQMYLFGQPTSSSNLPFRNLYNTTPEPSLHVGQPFDYNNSRIVDHDSSSGITQLSTSRVSLNIDSTHCIKSRASSAPPQPQNFNQPTNLKKYDTGKELAPNEPYFNPEFQKSLEQGKFVAQRLASILETCGLAQESDSQIFSMIQTANELRQFDAPSLCTIGIAGDSGAGKSSLINSLLNVPDLAETAGLGSACTSVVTEYRLKKPWHTAEYTIEIDRMTNEEIEEQLRELLWSYRCFHISDLDEKSMTADEQKHLQDRSNVAWDTLQAAFGSKKELTHTYLQDRSTGAEKRIQQQLLVWTNELQWPGDSQKSNWIGCAETVSECKSNMAPFLKLWPFIKIIRIFLSSQVLKTGCILADLPGFNDSNHARVKAAENYMYSCEEIFIVAEITRFATNKSVETILQKILGYELKNRRPSQGIALICTKSEDLDSNEIRRKFFADGRSIEAARVAVLEKKLEEAEINYDMRQHEEAQDELDYLSMTTRNEYVKNLVQGNYTKWSRDGPLSVFCVSNKMYKKNSRRARIHDLPIRGSGIPALRSHCHRIPARAQFKNAHHFLTVRLKTLVQEVQLWLAGGSRESMPNDATVQRMLETLHNDLQENILESVRAVNDTQHEITNNILLQPMTINLGNWTKKAIEISETWKRYHPSQVKAFCSNYGSWGKGKVEFTEWNLELIKPMVDGMTFWWDDYARESTATLTELQSKILSLLDSLISQVKDFHGAPLFAKTLATKNDLIKHIFVKTKTETATMVDSIKRDATQNHRSAYVYEEMLQAYRDCYSDSAKAGDHVTIRRLNRLRKAIGSPENPVLFKAIRSRIENAFFLHFVDIVADLEGDITNVLEQIGSNIEMLRGSEVKILAKNGNFLEKLSTVVASVKVDMENISNVAAKVNRMAEAQDNRIL